MEREVVITGYGIVSSIGNNCDEVLQSLKNNKSGVEEEYGISVNVEELANIKTLSDAVDLVLKKVD